MSLNSVQQRIALGLATAGLALVAFPAGASAHQTRSLLSIFSIGPAPTQQLPDLGVIPKISGVPQLVTLAQNKGVPLTASPACAALSPLPPWPVAVVHGLLPIDLQFSYGLDGKVHVWFGAPSDPKLCVLTVDATKYKKTSIARVTDIAQTLMGAVQTKIISLGAALPISSSVLVDAQTLISGLPAKIQSQVQAALGQLSGKTANQILTQLQTVLGSVVSKLPTSLQTTVSGFLGKLKL